MTASLSISLTPPQFQFVESKAKRPCFLAGFGSGKTEGLVNRLLSRMLANPENDSAYYAPTYDMINRIVVPRIVDKLNAYGVGYTPNKNERVMRLHGFGTVIFRSLSQPEKIAGYETLDSYVDEAERIKQAIMILAWQNIIGRNRQKSPLGTDNTIAVGTTPEGFGFVYEKWYKNPPNQEYELIRASTYSNAHNLPADYIDNMLQEYPPQLIQAYLNGEFVNLRSGRVYPEFQRVHNHQSVEIRPNEILHIGMDFNVRAMAAAVHVMRDDQPVQAGELYSIQDTPHMIDAIKETYPKNRCMIYPDSTGKNPTATGVTLTSIRQLVDAGFIISAPKGNPPVKDRVDTVNARICNSLGERFYQMDVDQCPFSAEGLEQQVYADNGKPDKDDKHDHMNDARGYFIHRRFPLAGRGVRVRTLKGL